MQVSLKEIHLPGRLRGRSPIGSIARNSIAYLVGATILVVIGALVGVKTPGLIAGAAVLAGWSSSWSP